MAFLGFHSLDYDPTTLGNMAPLWFPVNTPVYTVSNCNIITEWIKKDFEESGLGLSRNLTRGLRKLQKNTGQPVFQPRFEPSGSWVHCKVVTSRI
jgi:hypothetical protein